MISPRLASFFGRPLLACLSAACTAAFLLFLFCGLASPARAVHEEWNRPWDGPTHGNDVAYKVAVDKNGNVYVAGSSNPMDETFSGDYRLIKYGPDGTELWSRHYDGVFRTRSIITGLALDAAGDAYVTGYSVPSHGSALSFDYTTIKYDPNGNRLWLRLYDGSDQGDDEASAIAVDSAGDAFVTGYSEISRTRTFEIGVYATLKYAPDGRLLWTNLYNRPFHQGGLFQPAEGSLATSVAVDSTGNSYVTGFTQNGSDDPSSNVCTTIKYSPAGRSLWVRSEKSATGVALVVDAVGSVYVTNGSGSFLVIKYDTHGNEVWRGLPAPGQPLIYPSVLAVDSSGNALVAGYLGIVKYGSTGDFQWYRSNLGGNAIGVAVDAAGCVYVGGTVVGPNMNGLDNNLNFLVLKYGPDGSLHWRRDFDGPLVTDFFGVPQQSTDIANAMALDDLGNVYIVGSSQPYINGRSNMRTVKYSQ